MPIRLLLAVTCVLPRLMAAEATATLHLFDVAFNLNQDEGVGVLLPFAPATVAIGSGSLGHVEIVPNWATPPELHRGPFDPLDPASQYLIHIANGPVVASSPPPDMSLYLATIGGAVTFYNFSLNPVDLELFWHARYSLVATGATSLASVQVTEKTKDVGSDHDLTNKITFSASQPNDGSQLLAEQSGTILVSIAAATDVGLGFVLPSATNLSLSAEARSFAAVPEPGTCFLLLSGFFLLLARGWRPS